MTPLADWETIAANARGGTFTGDGEPVLVLHSTEGYSLDGAVATYRRTTDWPTATADWSARRKALHYTIDTSARALINAPGGVETNRRGRRVIQLEIVGFAAHMNLLPDDELAWLALEVIGPLCAAGGVELATHVNWEPYPASYGIHAPQRLTPIAWVGAAGILGHQHVPENDHGDPGALNVARILEHLAPPAPPAPRKRARMIIYSNDPGGQVLFTGDKLIALHTAAQTKAHTSAGVPIVTVDAEFWKRLVAAFPVL